MYYVDINMISNTTYVIYIIKIHNYICVIYFDSVWFDLILKNKNKKPNQTESN